MKFKLIIFDIDGTIAEPLSSWRYIHEKLGLWDDLAYRYQERFLGGKISYRKFCELDAAHWRGLSEKKIKRIFRKAPYSRNAVRSIKKLRKMGFKLAAVSTGLQYMADRVKKELKFDYVSANRLISRRGVLTGGVKINITHGAKGHILGKILRKFHVKPHEAICVGDSAGDIPLAKASGFSIAFNSSDETFSRIVNYNCHTNDFNEVFEIIRLISEGKANEEIIRAARGGGSSKRFPKSAGDALTRPRESPRMMVRYGCNEAPPMQVKVNEKTIEIFAGARVRDVLLKYSRTEWTLVRKNKKKVCDGHGHEVGLDGELDGGEELVITACGPEEPRP